MSMRTSIWEMRDGIGIWQEEGEGEGESVLHSALGLNSFSLNDISAQH
jgi:hypothetical protein